MNWRAASRKGMDSMSPDRPADLHERHVHAGLLAHADDPRLDLVGDVRDDLHGPAEEPPLPLLGDDGLVDLARGDGVVPPDGRRGEPAVVAEVQVRLRAVLGDVDLAVLVGAHRSRIHVDVGIDLDHADVEAPVFQEAADGRGSNTFSKPRADSAGDENVLAHGDWIIATNRRSPQWRAGRKYGAPCYSDTDMQDVPGVRRPVQEASFPLLLTVGAGVLVDALPLPRLPRPGGDPAARGFPEHGRRPGPGHPVGDRRGLGRARPGGRLRLRLRRSCPGENWGRSSGSSQAWRGASPFTRRIPRSSLFISSVPSAERAAFEALMRKEVDEGFAFREPAAGGVLHPAARTGTVLSRSPSWSPSSTAGALLGLDVATVPRLRNALEHAIASGKLTASAAVDLPLSASGRQVVWNFLAIHRGARVSDVGGTAGRVWWGSAPSHSASTRWWSYLPEDLSPAGIDLELLDADAPRGPPGPVLSSLAGPGTSPASSRTA